MRDPRRALRSLSGVVVNSMPSNSIEPPEIRQPSRAKPHGGKSDGGLAGTRLTDKSENLALVKRQVDPVDDFDPLLVGIAFDPKVLDLQEHIFLRDHDQTSFRPEDRNSIQSTTKLTATVSSAMAAAGISGVSSPNEISVAFSRTIDPQSAVGG